jgi:hypothetical protein
MRAATLSNRTVLRAGAPEEGRRQALGFVLAMLRESVPLLQRAPRDLLNTVRIFPAVKVAICVSLAPFREFCRKEK